MTIVTGTTSACAENTRPSHSHRSPGWNYLRVRGEYAPSGGGPGVWWELPPRARRILLNFFSTSQMSGTTSACAENTSDSNCLFCAQWNYLRVRGEYISLV